MRVALVTASTWLACDAVVHAVALLSSILPHVASVFTKVPSSAVIQTAPTLLGAKRPFAVTVVTAKVNAHPGPASAAPPSIVVR